MSTEAEKMRRELQEVRKLAESSSRGEPGCTCMNCGSTSLSPEGRFVDRTQELQVLRCAACGLAQLDRQIPEEELAELEDDNPEYRRPSDQDLEAAVRSHSFILDLIGEFLHGGRMLEVGCSHGYKLEAARQAGWKIQGIELSRRSCHVARNLLGLPVHRGTLETFSPDEPFDAVVAWHVLEHVPRLDVFLGLVHAMLRSGGYLFVQVPSYSQYRGKEPWSDHPECFTRVHYWYFGPEELRSVLEAHGFECVFTLDDPRLLHLTVAARRP